MFHSRVLRFSECFMWIDREELGDCLDLLYISTDRYFNRHSQCLATYAGAYYYDVYWPLGTYFLQLLYLSD